ncbi:MAG: SHOCT domain-containing protein [Nitrososphaerales archaeon]
MPISLAILFVLVGSAFFINFFTGGPVRGFSFFPFIGLFFLFFFAKRFFFPWGRSRRHYWRYEDTALNSLRERYARGEITRDQFEQMMSDLERHPSRV